MFCGVKTIIDVAFSKNLSKNSQLNIEDLDGTRVITREKELRIVLMDLSRSKDRGISFGGFSLFTIGPC